MALVERRVDPNSRRSYRIYLTEQGKALEDQLISIPVEVNQRALSSLNDVEQKQMMALLTKMVAAI